MKTSLFQLYEYIKNRICAAHFVKGFVVVLWEKKPTTSVQYSMSGPENTELQQT